MTETIVEIKKATIKDFPKSERPTEKLLSMGPSVLSNSELIAVIIRTGTGKGTNKDTAIDLASKLLNQDKRGIAYLANASVSDLTQVNGIGNCKAAQIMAAIELGKRIKRHGVHENIKVTSPEVIANLVMDSMKHLEKEHFDIAVLDTKNQIISIDNISIGTLNSSIVHPRDVFNIAIKKSANALILIHNHPSGDPTPSKEDISITNRLIESGEIVGIKVLDHIIIGNDRFLSLKEEKLM